MIAIFLENIFKSTSTDKLVYFTVETSHEALSKEGKQRTLSSDVARIPFKIFYFSNLEIAFSRKSLSLRI
jgi:hypothetical protein